VDENNLSFGVLGIYDDITERKQLEEALENKIFALTRPLDDPKSIEFEDLFKTKDIQRLQDEFAMATGVASIITKPDGTPITTPSNFCRLCSQIIRKTEIGRLNCFRSDAELGQLSMDGAKIQPCLSGGLWDAGAGIEVGGKHIANWLIGQVRDETQTEDKMRIYAREIGADEEAFIEAFREVPAMSRDKFGSISQVLFTLANQLSTFAYQNVQQARLITDLKKAEKEQSKLQSRLIQAQKMESVGRLAGGVAHDFNNMLSIISGNAEMVLEELDQDSDVADHLQEILKATRRSIDLTRQLLAFARKQTIAPQLLNLNDTIEGMLKMLRRLIGEDIDLKWLPAEGLWTVKMDPTQIDQIMANLCANARDCIQGQSGGEIIIETDNVSITETNFSGREGVRPGEYVMIAVSDSGCGMTRETLQNLFEPFFTTKDLGKGTGLGLATVYGIVQQNQGFVNVYSEPNMGSTFKIYLPKYADLRAEPRPLEEAPAEKGGGETILLVEDETGILQMTTRLLERIGYTVLATSSPREAIRIAQTHPGRIDMLMTDVVMPEMSGRQLVQHLTEIMHDMKYLYSSGYTDNVIAHHGVLEEGIHFINKPYTRQQLATKIREVLDR
jgi:signal transduction histidine kinase